MKQPFGAKLARSSMRSMAWIAANHKNEVAVPVSTISPCDDRAHGLMKMGQRDRNGFNRVASGRSRGRSSMGNRCPVRLVRFKRVLYIIYNVCGRPGGLDPSVQCSPLHD